MLTLIHGGMTNLALSSTVIWCFLALALACILTLASSMYDDFIIRKRRQRYMTKRSHLTPTVGSYPKSVEVLPQRALVRGFDSTELFREDLWLRRIDQARRDHAVRAASMRRPEINTGTGVREQRISAILAHHPGARCDN